MDAWQDPWAVDGSPLGAWRMLAACRHVDGALFFAPDGERPNRRDLREARAKAVCARCPVIQPCAAYAVEYGERYGVWGGLSERERAGLRRDRAG